MSRETTDLTDRTKRVFEEAERLQWETALILKVSRLQVERLRRLRSEIRVLYVTREEERERGLETLRRVYNAARIIPVDLEN